MRVFISYARSQEEWVQSYLMPLIETARYEPLVDYRRFRAGANLHKQLDAAQDEADFRIFLLCPAFFKSDACKHELEHAIKREQDLSPGKLIFVLRGRYQAPPDMFLPESQLIDLRDESEQPLAWDRLTRALAIDFGVSTAKWLRDRDVIRRYLLQGDAVNLVTPNREVKWRSLINHLQHDEELALGKVDFESSLTMSMRSTVLEFLHAAGLNAKPAKGKELIFLESELNRLSKPSCQAWLRFQLTVERDLFGANFFSVLSRLIEGKKIIPLIHSYAPFTEWMESTYEFSKLSFQTVEL